MYCTQSKKRKRVPLIIPVTQFRPRNARNCILESPILSISRGSCLRAPPRSSCLRYSTFAPAARKVHVRQLNHCIRYFQMLPKTLHRASANCWTKKSIYLDPCLPCPQGGRCREVQLDTWNSIKRYVYVCLPFLKPLKAK